LEKAIVSAKSGDAIYLAPETYDQPLPWIENDIEIIGTGDKVELLSNKESGEVFLFVNCKSSVKLSNLTIKANHSLKHLIVVKSGRLVLEKCTIDCSQVTLAKPILVLSDGASIEKRDYTEVINNAHSDSE